ncbi:bifunctional 4-hydroxy-2-oxoglutarate aldolase/2-dehydro-3-deoxy-phosphogluconate aldolase [Mumia sp. DW29H23]|uniref:bifunctional 4-hydroxy-2-oxoglutarate aldolase/2-dehydro-3-deoxy-phosphogluconate aldolase n=1 Tax=Mumia sp. DW29H23 TaxID=3421241 RepID=UPI003D69BD45
MAVPESPIRGIVAIVRLRRETPTDALLDALLAGGVRQVEITVDSPSAHEVISRWARRGDALVGAGTIRTAADAEAAIAAGAQFLVTPTTVDAVLDTARTRGVPVACGALTPTEIDDAWSRGAAAVKVFPIGTVGGVSYLKAVRAPLHDVPLLPTGGVDAGNITAYAAAGAVGVGVGSSLVSEDLVAAGDWDAVRERALSLVEAWEAGRDA